MESVRFLQGFRVCFRDSTVYLCAANDLLPCSVWESADRNVSMPDTLQEGLNPVMGKKDTTHTKKDRP